MSVFPLPATFRANPPVSEIVVREFRDKSNYALPSDYLEFLRRSNGGEGALGATAYLMLWRLEEVLELNAAYEAEQYIPGFLIFGSDGGGEAFAFDTSSPTGTVLSVPFVGMSLELAKPVGDSFKTFIEVLKHS